MKIAVITLHFVQHYGSLLQAYATCRLFEKLGHTAQIIDYVRPNCADEKQVILDGLKKKGSENALFAIAYILTKRVENISRKKFSQGFLKTHIPMTGKYQTFQELSQLPPEADVYCTGSDQVWNSEYNGGYLPEYFLEFAPENKRRIAFAASIGMERFPQEEYDQTRASLMKYSAISVREASAQKILEDMGLQQVVHVLDPTLCLTKSDWEAIISRRRISKPYILLYKLNDAPELETFAGKLAKSTGLQLIRISYYLNHFKKQGKMIYSPPVEDFLSLIYYAEHIITDSFHCAAFSLNFEKDLFAFYPEHYSTRLRSVLELVGAQHRAVNTAQFQPTPIDYNGVNSVLQSEREKAVKFLRDALCDGIVEE